MAEESQDRNKGALKVGRVFAKEILIPILLALIVIQFAIQAFKIPSASMEDSLLVGDFLLGLKFVYGASIPFTDKKLPGFTDPSPGEVLIFRYPGDPAYPEGNRERFRFLANLFLFGNIYWDTNPSEGQNRLVWYMPKDFIKRSVAQSGQTIRLEGKKLLINGVEAPLPPEGKYTDYREMDPQRDSTTFHLPAPGHIYDFDTLSLRDASWIRSLALQENPDKKVELKLDLIKDSVIDNDYVLPYLRADARLRASYAIYALLNLEGREVAENGAVFLQATNVPFRTIQDAARTGFIRLNDLSVSANMDGSFPRSGGRRVEYNDYFMGHYLEIIGQNIIGQGYAAGGNYTIRPSLILDGETVDTYTIKDKVYFMMGDNRDNSSDSRYWGPLSKQYVKAKAFIIYFSLDGEEDGAAISARNPLSWALVPFKTRWSRVGKLIE